MFKRLVILLFLIVLGILAFAATKPNIFRVQRSITIQATPEKIFPLLNNFKNWEAWSPWEKKDLSMKRSYSGPESGKGAKYEWDGNDEVGKGSMEIVDENPPQSMALRLSFERPFVCVNNVDFQLEAKDAATHVVWSMDGPNPYLSKLMQVFMNMEKMVGTDFEIGLNNLKTAAEK